MTNPQDHALINSWNQIRPVTSQDCVPDLVERICKKYPDKLAVISSNDGLSLTYERLNKLASRLAGFLVTKYNLGRGAVIPLCFDKSPLAVVAMLAVLKAGAAYCCLDPQHPRARHDFILQSVKASLVLVSPEHQGLFSSPVLMVDCKLLRELDDSKGDDEPNFDQKRPGDTCIVAFSSGSTGAPKGIVHTHETLTTGLVQNGPRHGLDRPGIRVFQWCAYTFDISLTEIWGTLICGGVMCIPSEHERLNDVESAMSQMAVEWAFFTPSFARFFCRQHYRVETLKTLAVGGEALTQQDAHTFLEDLDLDRVVQVFGPAEFITMFLKTVTGRDPYPEDEMRQSEYVPFVPSNAHSWIVDPDDVERLAPVGAVGELLIEGPALFTGYLNDAQRTEAALVKAPQWRESMNTGPPAFRIYRSGDLVRYLGNGEMRYVSRKDGVVKLRGQFVDLGEIESLLRTALSSVLEGINMPAEMEAETAVLLATPQSVSFIPAGDQALVAFIRPNRNEKPKDRRDILRTAAKVLQTQLRKKVPEYMVPRLFYPIDAFPYNASGKLDRKALTLSVPSLDPEKWLRLSGPDSTEVSASANGELLNGHSPVARKHDGETHQVITDLLRKAWVDVLGLPESEFSIHDDFFQKGGNSMRAMELVAAARRHGISVTVGKIFGNPVFDHLVSAASISPNCGRNGKQGDHTRSSAETVPFSLLGPESTKDEILMQSITQCGLNEVDVQDILPATPLQSEFMNSGIRKPGTFVAQTWLAVPSNITIDRFQKVWKQLNNDFPTLRCRMVHIGDAKKTTCNEDFLVLLNSQRPLDWVKVAGGTQLDTYLAQDRATPMGYGDALVRYAILDNTMDAEHGKTRTMVLTMHQCIYDGFTVKRLHQAMNELLNCEDDSTAFATTSSFAPFLEHITIHSNNRNTECFWNDYFVGYGDGNTDGATRKQQSPFPALPDTFCVIEADSLFATNIQTPALGPNLKHITLPTIVLAGWTMVMNHYTGDTDIVLPMHVSGRGLPVPGIMDMAFPTIANVPVRVQLPTDLLEFLAHSAEQPTATTPRDLEQRQSVEEFLQKLQQDQIQLGTTTVSHAGLSAIITYSDSCRKAVNVCKHHPQGSLDIQYATATFRPDAGKNEDSNISAAKINVEMQVNVQDAKYFSPDDALSLGCYLLDGGVVRLVFVYDSKVVRKEQISEYATKLETSIRALVSVLGAGYERM
ncbi:NRPS [Diaporthe eres]|uniref:NRPS n=1 Tax=Diaporthe eres TaxID=83184 RepID=A0ABR1NPJ2_DIAER